MYNLICKKRFKCWEGGHVSRAAGCCKQTEPAEGRVSVLEKQELDEQGQRWLFKKHHGDVVDEIPISELLKKQDLKFFGDMWERTLSYMSWTCK